jgi:hypothetical protein
MPSANIRLTPKTDKAFRRTRAAALRSRKLRTEWLLGFMSVVL